MLKMLRDTAVNPYYITEFKGQIAALYHFGQRERGRSCMWEYKMKGMYNTT